MNRSPAVRPLIWALILPVLLLPFPGWAASAPEPAPATRSRDGAAREKAYGRLLSAGLSVPDAQKRLASLSREEISYLARSPIELRRGGDAGGVILFLVFVGLLCYFVVDLYHHSHS